MEIVFSSINDQKTRFVLSGADPSFANAFRRAMYAEVPTLAIEHVRIYDNTSALFDEMLSHRLGLIPIVTEPGSFVPESECSCNGAGCAGCSVTFSMSVEGPKVVTSGDLLSSDPALRPALDSISIVKLEKGQKIVREARAVLNTSKEHSKWQPVTVCGYKNYPVITVEANCDGCGLCIDECPRSILEKKSGKVSVVDGKLESCSLCRLCEKACLNSGIGDEPAIRIASEPERFIFVVESDGSLKTIEIMEGAIRFLKNHADGLSRELEEVSG
jgi:DNA-directed RNA polymerase subunit D